MRSWQTGVLLTGKSNCHTHRQNGFAGGVTLTPHCLESYGAHLRGNHFQIYEGQNHNWI